MTKLDENDIIEAALIDAVTEALGGFAVFLSFLFYLGCGLFFILCGGVLLTSALSEMFNAFFA
mgnify:CR=1 FL=1|jgi:hypothetical protein